MRGFLFNLHVLRCKHCRSFLGCLDPDTALMFLCRTGFLRASAMLRANGIPVPSYPPFVEAARP